MSNNAAFLIIMSIIVIVVAMWADRQIGQNDDDDYPNFI